MSEWRDPAIKLFGRKIPLQDDQTPIEEVRVADPAPAVQPTSEDEKDTCSGKANIEVELEPKNTLISSVLNNSTEVSNETSTEAAKAADKLQPERDDKESCISGDDKLLKKPDKVLPCPRCNSMETKFCYYNNYNVNQPRHFCKNCQRYWTAGGSMRNVPVGAGRRKNKHNASTYRHTAITPDALASIQADGPDSIDHKSLSPFKGNSTLLKFGPDAPLCESMVSMLNLGEQNLKPRLDFAADAAENRDETSCSSASKPEENVFPDNNNQQKFMHSSPHLQYFPGPLWGYPWNPAWNNAQIVASQENDIVAHMSSCNQSPLFPPTFCPPYPFPFLPPFWGWTGGQPWSLPWSGNSEMASPSSCASASTSTSTNISPTLGKHSREEKTEKSLWIPKTLRINDPDEAAKSSIFATLGIKPVEAGKFKAFSFKTGNAKEEASNATQVLHANPAAMSRSQSFQEITS